MRPEYPFEAPEYGETITIAPGLDWLRLPLPMALDHINIYILHDEDGLTIIDAALKTDTLKALWKKVLAQYDKPLKRVVITHYHPDHIGLAAWLAEEYGAELIMTRMTYLLTRMLQLDVQERPRPQQAEYWKRAGYPQDWIDERMSKRPFNFLDSTEALPIGVRTLLEGDEFEAGGRKWTARFSGGHAPDHLSLWSDEFVLIGDHCLPAITPVISVFATEPNADPLSEFMQSSLKLAQFADDQTLFWPGHNRPFLGGRSRLEALAHHHEKALARLMDALAEPKTMIDCYPLLFRRKITPQVEGFAISEATAHFNHLRLQGKIQIVDTDPILRWQRC